METQTNLWSVQGLLAERPAATAAGVAVGYRYFATDVPQEYLVVLQAGVRTWVPVAGAAVATGGYRRLFVYTDGPVLPTQVDVYNDWATLYGVWVGYNGPKDILFKPTVHLTQLHIPAVGMPPGGYVIGRGNGLLGTGTANWSEAVLDDGVILEDVTLVAAGLTLVGNSSAHCLTYTGIGVVPQGLTIAEGSALRNDGPSAPMINWTAQDFGTSTTRFYFTLNAGAKLANGANDAAIIDVTPAGPFVSAIYIVCYGGEVQPRVLSGAMPPGTTPSCTFVVDGGQLALDQQLDWPAPISLVSPAAFQSIQHVRRALPSGPVTSGVHGMPSANTLVTIRPDGTLTPITIVLPDPASCPGEEVLVKNLTDDIATSITVVAAASSIDDLPSDVWPASPKFARRYISDGAYWWSV